MEKLYPQDMLIQATPRPIRKSSLCGIVLAGGEGQRLQTWIQRLRGNLLPKQYINFIGTRSMLEHTFHRAEKIIPSERLFTVINLTHLRHPEVKQQLSDRPRGTVIVQPENKETGPGLVLPLMHIYKRYSDSVVAVFPSDHFVLDEDLFMSYVSLAALVVEREPSCVVLLGMEPDGGEQEYGYILPGAKLNNGMGQLDIYEISSFIEKPGFNAAQHLIHCGALWNTMVMVFKASTLLSLVHRVSPTMYWQFQRILEVIGTPLEANVIEEVYREIEPVNFSRELLEGTVPRYPSRLVVLPVWHVLWSDWGSEERVVDILKKTGYLDRLNGFSSKAMRI